MIGSRSGDTDGFLNACMSESASASLTRTVYRSIERMASETWFKITVTSSGRRRYDTCTHDISRRTRAMNIRNQPLPSASSNALQPPVLEPATVDGYQRYQHQRPPRTPSRLL